MALYANKRWGELSEGERNIILREGGIVAARVTTSAKIASGRLHWRTSQEQTAEPFGEVCCDLGCASTYVSKSGKSEAEQRERCGFGHGVALNNLSTIHNRGDKQVFETR